MPDTDGVLVCTKLVLSRRSCKTCHEATLLLRCSAKHADECPKSSTAGKNCKVDNGCFISTW